MRASRLLSILLMLQTRGRLTAETLAASFEVSVRTVYRDIDQLSAAGVPVYADRGRGGGFQLMEGYRTQLTGLSSSEAETLFLAGLPGPAAQLGLGDAMAQAQLKLLAALPAEGRQGAARVASRFHLDPIGWFRSAEHADVLPSLALAVWNARRIAVRYDAWAGVVDRALEPLGLVLKAGVWYLVAAAEPRDRADGRTPRTYRVNQILDLTVLDERFERPSSFDLAGYWAGYLSQFQARLHQGEAVVRFSPGALERLPELVGADVRAAVAATGRMDRSGWVRAT